MRPSSIRASLKIHKGEGYIPIILTGITCDPPELFDLFDEIKLNMVADTLVTGSRYLEGIVDEEKEPFDATHRQTLQTRLLLAYP